MSGHAHRPSLRFGREGSVAAVPGGCFDWVVHRGRCPVAFLTTSLAGLGAAEQLDASVEVEPAVDGVVTTQGPSSLLRTEVEAVHRWRLRIGRGGHLTFLPWLLLPYPGSLSRCDVAVRLEPEATLCAWDVLAVGRVARGELLALAGLWSAWAIDGPDGRLLDDRLWLDGRLQAEARAALGGSTHVGTLYLAGFPDESLAVDHVRAELRGLELAGASRPAVGLIVVRALDRSAERIERLFWRLVCLGRARAGVASLSPEAVGRRWLEGEPGRS